MYKQKIYKKRQEEIVRNKNYNKLTKSEKTKNQNQDTNRRALFIKTENSTYKETKSKKKEKKIQNVGQRSGGLSPLEP